MLSDIKNLVESCDVCQKLRPSLSKEPLAPRPQAKFPMQEVSVDLFEYGGKSYVTMVDKYSGYLFVEHLTRLSTDHVIQHLRNWFLLFGFPQTIVSDNGPQFRTDFGKFCTSFGAVHVTSSPYFPQSNGQAESAVKNAKYLLIKCLESDQDFQFALSEFRRVPRADSFSPAQLMFGYSQRGILPSVVNPVINLQTAEEARQKTRTSQKSYFDQGSHLLAPLAVGSKVHVQHPLTKRWDSKASILHILDSGRSYDIQFHDGRTTRRNRRFLRPFSYADCAKEGIVSRSSDITSPVSTIQDRQSILISADKQVRKSPRLLMKKAVRYAI